MLSLVRFVNFPKRQKIRGQKNAIKNVKMKIVWTVPKIEWTGKSVWFAIKAMPLMILEYARVLRLRIVKLLILWAFVSNANWVITLVMENVISRRELQNWPKL